MIKLIAAFSPKGGAGTSLIIANLAIYLAQKGKKVLLIDAAPNEGTLHTYLGLPTIAVSNEASEHFSILPLIETQYQNLRFFSNLRTASSGKITEYINRWLTEIKQGQFDFLFIDMGSVINEDLFDIIGLVDYSLMFTTPDFIATEKCNYFFKELTAYRLRNVESKHDITYSLQMIKKTKKDWAFTFRNLLLLLSQTVPKFSTQIAEIVNDLKIGVVYNCMRSSLEHELPSAYQFLIKSNFGVDVKQVCEFAFSDAVMNSLVSMKPAVTDEKNSEFVATLYNFASNLSHLLFQKNNNEKKVQKLPVFNYYEFLGLERGCSNLEINNRCHYLKQLYVNDNPILRNIYQDNEIFILNTLIDCIHKELNDIEIRREYDIEIDSHTTTLESSVPDIFILNEVIKKYNRNKKGNVELVKKDIFDRNAEQSTSQINDIDEDFVDVNNIFSKFRSADIVNGALLKKIREELNISLKSIISETKISNFIINAIENDDYSKLPANIYIRGFLKLYCQSLKLNKGNTEIVISEFIANKNHPKPAEKPVQEQEVEQ